MVDVSRRGFLGQAAVATGVGVAGGLGLHRLLVAPNGPTAGRQPSAADNIRTTSANTPVIAMDGVTLAGPMVVHVRDVVSGELSMMIGTQELIYRDPDLVSRLVKTAATAGRAEG